MQIHPDGLILATGGTDHVVRIWDIKQQSNVLSFESHTGNVTGVAFSENGYYMASASTDGTVRLWDLRARKDWNIHTITIEGGAHAVSFDHSGTYLAVAGGHIEYVCLVGVLVCMWI